MEGGWGWEDGIRAIKRFNLSGQTCKSGRKRNISTLTTIPLSRKRTVSGLPLSPLR